MTGDLKAASVEWTIQWQVIEPDKFLFRFDDPESEMEAVRVISTAAQTVMNRLVGDYSLDEVLTEKRGEVADEARDATQEILDHFACGISIRDLQMQRVIPPQRVKPAFDKVNVSIQDRDRLESEANKERNKLLPAAYAKKDKLIREAEGDADRSRAEALGEIEALLARYRAYSRSPTSTRRRMYLERMEEVLGQVEDKVIIDADLDQILPLLNLQSGETP
jgi:membrane protease subunit HflK